MNKFQWKTPRAFRIVFTLFGLWWLGCGVFDHFFPQTVIPLAELLVLLLSAVCFLIIIGAELVSR